MTTEFEPGEEIWYFTETYYFEIIWTIDTRHNALRLDSMTWHANMGPWGKSFRKEEIFNTINFIRRYFRMY